MGLSQVYVHSFGTQYKKYIEMLDHVQRRATTFFSLENKSYEGWLKEFV